MSPRGISFSRLDDDDDSGGGGNDTHLKRDRKSRPTRHTDSNRRRNTESSTGRSRSTTREQQQAVGLTGAESPLDLACFSHQDDMFHLFLVNDNYYYFFRLHQLLCERLLKMFQQSLRLIEQDSRESKDSGSHRHRPSPSAAAAFRASNRCMFHLPNDRRHAFIPMPFSSSDYTRGRILPSVSRHGT